MATYDPTAENGSVEQLEQIEQRDVRALTQYLTVLDDIDRAAGAEDLYLVVSQSGESYLVDAREGACECPDHEYRDVRCKHLRRVAFATGERSIPGWVDRDGVDPDLGEHVAGEVRFAAADGGQVVRRTPTTRRRTRATTVGPSTSRAAWPSIGSSRICWPQSWTTCSGTSGRGTQPSRSPASRRCGPLRPARRECRCRARAPSRRAARPPPDQGTSGCPECGGQVVMDGPETVCADCGLVVDEQRIDHGPEWRSFEDERSDTKRTGAPLTEARHDRGLSTEIGRYRDGNENRLSGRKRSQLSRLRREHSRAQLASKVDRNLAHGCAEICRIESALGLGESVRDRACWLFRSAQSEDLLRGRSIEAMAGASVFAACRCAGLGRQIEAVARVSQVDEGRVQNSYDVLNVELGLAAVGQRPPDFVPQLASDIVASDEVRHRDV